MSMPSPFDIGRGISENVSGAFEQNRSNTALDDILSQAARSNDPRALDQLSAELMKYVSPQQQPAAAQLLKNKQAEIMNAQKNQQQRQDFQSLNLNPALAGIDPSIANQYLKGQQDIQSGHNTELLQSAFDRSEELLKGGRTGIFTGAKLTPQGRRERTEFDSIGEIFISQLIPILNPRGAMPQSRFDYIKSLVPNSKYTDATNEGKLNGLRKIFAGDLSDVKMEDGQNKAEPESNFVQMKDPNGVIRSIPANMVQQAQQAGGTLVQ